MERRDEEALKRRNMIPIVFAGVLIAMLVIGNYNFLTPSLGETQGQTEPNSLGELVDCPASVTVEDLPEGEVGPALGEIMDDVEGFEEIQDKLDDKGYDFDKDVASISRFWGSISGEQFSGYALSWWSGDGPDGTRAFIAAALLDDGTSTVFGVITNLLPPDQVSEIDPYIIVNAMPYIYVDWYWWVWGPIPKIVRWNYWWYDSHSHPNWYWGSYWWWRTYIRWYWEGWGEVWRPWWWWFWSWMYWKHWYWWSTYFPY